MESPVFFSVKRKKWREILAIRDFSVENIAECSSLICDGYKCIIICIYRPPTGNIETFFTAVNNILEDTEI